MSRVRPWDMPPAGLDIPAVMETNVSVQARMLARLGTYKPDGITAPLAPLAGKDDDPAVTLLDAWATMADVLYFYQRRLLAEGFVGTAAHARSVHALVDAVSVDMVPALAASVVLCFTVSNQQDGVVDVPQGTGVQSVPGAGGGPLRGPSRTDVTPPLTLPMSPTTDPALLPQIFETSDDLAAQAAFNAMTLAPTTAADDGAVRGDALGILARGGSYGVTAGDPIFLVAPAAGGGPAFAALRTVLSIGRARARGCTLFLWSEDAPLLPGADGAGPLPTPIPGLQGFTSRALDPLFGSDVPAWSDLTLDLRARFRAMVGGLQRYDEAKAAWETAEPPAPVGYPDVGRTPLGQIVCLAADRGVLLAGVAGRGLLRRTDDAASWVPVTGIPTTLEVLCLARDAAGRRYAGTSRGVFRSADGGRTWDALVGGGMSPSSPTKPAYMFYRLPATPVRGLAVIGGVDGPAVIAGTDDGLFRWDPTGRFWPVMNPDPLPGAGASATLAVRALVTDPTGTTVYAGTDRGLFSHPAADLVNAPWSQVGGTSGFDVSALGVDGRGVVYAGLGTRGGLAVRASSGTWTKVGGDLADATVTSIVTVDDTPSPAVFVGSDHGVYRSTDGGLSFPRLGASGPDDLPVTALAVSPAGDVLAATPFTGVQGDGWPAWPIARGRLDLARTTTRIAPGDRVALVQDDGRAEPMSVVLDVLAVATADRDDLGRRQRITTLTVSDVDLSGFDRRQARVYVAGTEIPLFSLQVRSPGAVTAPGATLDQHLADDADFAELTRDGAAIVAAGPTSLDLDGVLPDLTGRLVVVSGKPLRARAARELILESGDTRQAAITIVAGDVMDALEIPDRPDGSGSWTLRTRLGAKGKLLAEAGDLVLLPAASDADTVSQSVRILHSVAESRPQAAPAPLPVTRVTLDKPLDGLLDAATVTVMGNAVNATHGRTVQPDKEILGVSDGSENLRFTLRNKPLTWIEKDGVRSPEIEVWVQKHRYARVDSFAGQGADSLVYVVETNADGASIVCFGDGVRGRRPPAEAEIDADYRYGAGAAGNVGAGLLTLIRQRTLGLKTVINPLAATGGVDAEPAVGRRDRAPLAVRAQGRVVSLRDVEDVALSSPGIALACVTRLSKDRRRTLFLTVATADEGAAYALERGSTEYSDLTQALAGVRGLEIGSAEVVYFDVSVLLAIDPGVASGPVQDAARAALLEAFGFDSRELRQSVAESDIVAALAGLSGVRGVQVVELARHRGEPAKHGVLAASDAGYDAPSGRWSPAELLLVNADGGGVTVGVMGAAT